MEINLPKCDDCQVPRTWEAMIEPLVAKAEMGAAAANQAMAILGGLEGQLEAGQMLPGDTARLDQEVEALSGEVFEVAASKISKREVYNRALSEAERVDCAEAKEEDSAIPCPRLEMLVNWLEQ